MFGEIIRENGQFLLLFDRPDHRFMFALIWFMFAKINRESYQS